jgi:hypothetical protein
MSFSDGWIGKLVPPFHLIVVGVVVVGKLRFLGENGIVITQIEPRYKHEVIVRGLCWNGLRDHKRHNNMLDSNYSPAYTHFKKKDRLHKVASIIS